MRYWARVTKTRQICGGGRQGCQERVLKGEPVFVMETPTHTFYRCPACADEPVPENLPAVTERPAREPGSDDGPIGMTRIGTIAKSTRVDYKLRASGD